MSKESLKSYSIRETQLPASTNCRKNHLAGAIGSRAKNHLVKSIGGRDAANTWGGIQWKACFFLHHKRRLITGLPYNHVTSECMQLLGRSSSTSLLINDLIRPRRMLLPPPAADINCYINSTQLNIERGKRRLHISLSWEDSHDDQTIRDGMDFCGKESDTVCAVDLKWKRRHSPHAITVSSAKRACTLFTPQKKELDLRPHAKCTYPHWDLTGF